jgi:hypothetical protein
MSEARTATFETNAAPVVAGPQVYQHFNTYDEYAAGMDGLSFGWLYARFVEYMKLNNIHPDGTSVPRQRMLAKRVDVDNSTGYYYADQRNFTANMHLTDPVFFNMSFPMAVSFLGLSGVLENATALAEGANDTAAALLPPVPELLYCGVKWKGDDDFPTFVPVDNPEIVQMWMKDVRGLLVAIVAMLAILLATACLGLCLSVLRGRRFVSLLWLVVMIRLTMAGHVPGGRRRTRRQGRPKCATRPSRPHQPQPCRSRPLSTTPSPCSRPGPPTSSVTLRPPSQTSPLRTSSE